MVLRRALVSTPTVAALAVTLLLVLVPAAVLAQAPTEPAGRGRGGVLGCPARVDPKEFVDKIDNRYLPLVPGTTFVYEGSEEGKDQREVFEVTKATKTILGVKTTVVLDTVTDGKGDLIERTLDWFAQDKEGNVWYFGEASKDYKNGKVVSTEGSWEAGVKGARPGILMPANPRVGDTYRQECAPGVAEDTARVLDLATSVKVPYGSFTNALKTREWNPLDPGPVEHKFYVPCIGNVRSLGVKGGKAEFVLVEVKGGPRDAKNGCRGGPGHDQADAAGNADAVVERATPEAAEHPGGNGGR